MAAWLCLMTTAINISCQRISSFKTTGQSRELGKDTPGPKQILLDSEQLNFDRGSTSN